MVQTRGHLSGAALRELGRHAQLVVSAVTPALQFAGQVRVAAVRLRRGDGLGLAGGVGAEWGWA